MFHSVFPANLLIFYLLKCFVFQDIFLRKGKIQKKKIKIQKEREKKNPRIKKKKNKRYKDLTK